MPIEVFNCEQRSEEWHTLHLGLPTASRFKSILAVSDKMAMRRRYAREKAAEIITRIAAEGFRNSHTDRGLVQEDEARATYAFTRNVELVRVGFIYNPEVSAGCSPDGLIGDDGMAEFKSMLPELVIELIETSVFPQEHYAQVQGGLLVAERAWCDFVAYAPKLPLFVKRVYRDIELLARLRKEIASFNFEVAQLVKYVRRYGGADG